MAATSAASHGSEYKTGFGGLSTPGIPEGPKSGQGALEQQDRESQPGHHKLRAWKDGESCITSSRRSYATSKKSQTSAAQVPLCKLEKSLSAPSKTPSITVNDLPSDAIALILRKTLHPYFPGSIWGKNIYSAVHEARWFLMDGRNQSHRVLDKFPHDSCIASAQTSHALRSALVCKRWYRIMFGEEGPGVIDHAAICGSKMPTRVPRTIKTLFIHGQSQDTLWRLVSNAGLAQLEAVLTMRSQRSGSFMYKLATCCPELRHVGIASPRDGCEALSRRDLMYLGRLRHLCALELVDCDIPTGLAPLVSASLTAGPSDHHSTSPRCVPLRRLTLRCCLGVTAASLHALAPLARTLQMLVLEDVNLAQAVGSGAGGEEVGNGGGAMGRVEDGRVGLRAVAALTDLRSLTLTSCDGVDRAGLEALTVLQGLQYLDITDVWEFSGDTLQPLQSLTSLKVLALTDCESLQSSQLTALRWLTALASLDLSRCSRVDAYALRHVAVLTGLTSLSLQDCESVNSRAMRHLRDLRALQRLNLAGCRGIQTASLRHLRGLSALEMLSLNDLSRVGDAGLKWLRGLPSLRTLFVAGCAHITEDGLKAFEGSTTHVFT